MKKFTKILICLMLFVVGFAFVACGDNRTEEEKSFTYPSLSDKVYGNGGLAVRKGNYVYFVNGYHSITSDKVTKNGTYNVGSLMLMKLGANGQVVTNDDGLLKDEYYITMSNKLCGYQATNLFIYKDYLYFVSPCLENESGDETWAKERVVFNRIKLDKTGKVEEVYSSGVKYDQLKYEYYEANNNLYILAWEQGDSYYAENGNNVLIRVDATRKSSEIVSKDVTDVVFAKKSNEIFFSKKVADDENYYLKQYNVGNNNVINYNTFEKTFDLQFVANGKVYITMAHPSGSTKDIKVSTIETRTGFELFYGYDGSGELYVTDDGLAVVIVSGKNITLVTGVASTVKIKDDEATSIKVIGYANGCIFYYDLGAENTNIKYVSYSNAVAGSEVEINTLTSVSVIEEDCAYFDLGEQDYMYFLNKSGDNYYLNRIKVNNNFDEKEEMFGVYSEGDAPEKEVEDEVEEEE